MTKQQVQAKPASDLDYDLAMLGEPLTETSMLALDAVLDAREQALELLATLNRVQRLIETGHDLDEARGLFATDLDDVVTSLHANIVAVVTA